MERTLGQTEQTMPTDNKYYYILRLWRTEHEGSQDWRASVEIPEAGKRIGFASLEQLFAFLIDVTEDGYSAQSHTHSDSTGISLIDSSLKENKDNISSSQMIKCQCEEKFDE